MLIIRNKKGVYSGMSMEYYIDNGQSKMDAIKSVAHDRKKQKAKYTKI